MRCLVLQPCILVIFLDVYITQPVFAGSFIFLAYRLNSFLSLPDNTGAILAGWFRVGIFRIAVPLLWTASFDHRQRRRVLMLIELSWLVFLAVLVMVRVSLAAGFIFLAQWQYSGRI